jgi:hypothetical protein
MPRKSDGPQPTAHPHYDVPLAIFAEEADPLVARRQTQWIWALLAIGLAARLVRYLLRFPLWEDEAMLSANYLDRGYMELLQPLNYSRLPLRCSSGDNSRWSS